MAIYLLDTTTLTHLHNGNRWVEANYTLHSNPVSGDVLGVASVNVEEVVGGWLAYLQRARNPTTK